MGLCTSGMTMRWEDTEHGLCGRWFSWVCGGPNEKLGLRGGERRVEEGTVTGDNESMRRSN